MTLGYVATRASAQNSGTALSNFTTAASLLQGNAAQALCTWAPDDWFIGKSVNIRAMGQVSNVVTVQPTFTFNVNFGATTVFTTGAITCSTTAHTNVPWWLDIMLTCRAVGGSANLMGLARIESRAFIDTTAVADSVQTMTTLTVPKTAPAVGNNFNSNASQQVDLQAACSAANASNAIQLMQYWLVDMHCTG